MTYSGVVASDRLSRPHIDDRPAARMLPVELSGG